MVVVRGIGSLVGNGCIKSVLNASAVRRGCEHRQQSYAEATSAWTAKQSTAQAPSCLFAHNIRYILWYIHNIRDVLRCTQSAKHAK